MATPDSTAVTQPTVKVDLDAGQQLARAFLRVRPVIPRSKSRHIGFEVEYLHGQRPPVFFRKNWLEKKGFDAELVFMVDVNGRSMEPSLFEGDCVMVNTGDQTPRDGEVFAFNYGGELVVKRLIHDGTAWLMRSDNPDKIHYGDKYCNERTQIIGRAVHKQSDRI